MSKILVIGESCRDVFVYCSATRLCPDVPVPVLNILHQKDNPGMAYNVYRNILALSKDCFIYTNPDWNSITKTRYVDEKSNQHFVRVDSPHRFSRIDMTALKAGDWLNQFDVVAISDYNKGFLHEEDISEICKLHPCVFLDTKKPIGDFAKDAAFIKINDFEYKNSLKTLTPELESRLIHTAGGDGCFFNGRHFPVDRVEVKDVSGAGDSFFAALVFNYFTTKNILYAIIYANQKASEVVKHRGVTTI